MKAALGDGSLWIWNLVQEHLVGFTPILDFVHLLPYLYAAGQAAFQAQALKAWKFYEKLLRLAWGGKVAELLGALEKEAQRLGTPPKDAAESDPRQILATALGYVAKNRDKMDYPHYRREGLPISSAPVESLIKQVKLRVKGTEKFWVHEGLDAVLQVRAASLSDDGRLERFWKERPASRAAGRSRFKGQRDAA